MKETKRINRRKFIGATAAAATITSIPRHVVAGSGKPPPSGQIAIALRAGHRVDYDSDSMRITNHEEDNQYLTRSYRPSWEL